MLKKKNKPITPDIMDEEAYYAEEIVSFGKLVWRRFYKHKLAVIGLIGLIIIIFCTLAAPLLTPYGYEETHMDLISMGQPLPPNKEFILGTDNLGRDYLTRLLYGGRISLLVGVCATVIALVIGVPLGCLSGYYGGWIDMIVCRVIEFMSCVPTFFLQLTLSMFFPGGLASTVLVLGVFGWTGIARQVRAQFMSLKKKEYVQAAITLGYKDRVVIFKHILPNALMPVIILATSSVASAIMSESGLSFLGLGVQEPIPTWGSMLNKAQPFIRTMPSMTLIPGILITIITVCLSFIGDGLRDALDPRTRL